MFEDENEQRHGGQRNGKQSLSSNRDALTNNSAVKAALFVLGLMVCIIIIYFLIFRSGTASGTPETTTPAGATPTISGSATPDPNATQTPAETPPAPTEAPFSFRKGDRDPKIKQIQQLLKDKKYLDAGVETSEEFGSKTEAAVKEFQKAIGAEQTGIIDNALYTQLQTAGEKETPFVLQSGSKGQKVKDLQDLLVQKKYLDLGGEPTTDFYGAKTVQAVKDFQKANNLEQTGKVDNALFKKIQEASEKTG